MRAVVQRTVLVPIFLTALFTAQAQACEKSVGHLVSRQGVVETRAPDQATWQAVKLNHSFCLGDAVRTGARSRAAVVLTNETIVRLDQFTTLTLSGLDDADSWIDLLSGAAHFLSRTPRALKVKTPYINAGIEGTEFVVRASTTEGSVTVLEGRVLADNAQGAVPLRSGESAVAGAGQMPVKRLVLQPRDAVQWSLYYPPLFERSALSGADPWAQAARHSFDAYLRADSAAAFVAIDAVPRDTSDARFFNYRAALLLSVGRLEEAQADIARSHQLSPENANADALQSVVALARNDNRAAMELAHKANTRDRESVSAWVALSYAQQAAFDLDAARASMEQALLRDPENILALARLAELWLSLGDLKRAQDIAERAVSINPNIARTQTVLGFAYLTRIKTATAQQTFEKAIGLDSADPLARLGLGLALIRQGKLETGRREIEIGAALDPNNALIRSYLGKAYYEEKRNPLAAAQLDIAKQLDPHDPTPWFYDAIRKQTENLPGAALHDLQKSIDLNDNRALYRSRLLLDQDAAVRNVSQGRIYRDLGFDTDALAEGWESLNLDPRNFSAHRLLADSYSALPRHEIARTSELLQSQMLQPLNLVPLQPQLAQTDLPLFYGAGPSATGFSEFNPLFTRDGLHAQLNGVIGSNQTAGNDFVVSGLSDRVSYSIAQSHFESQGFRLNNDIKQNAYSAFIQTQLTPHSSIQLELRHQDRKNGDLALLFDPNIFSRNNREGRSDDTARIGYHFSPSVDSDLLVSVTSSRTKLNQNISDVVGELFPGAPIIQDEQSSEVTDGSTLELQFLADINHINYIIGAGQHRQQGNRSGYTVFSVFGVPLFPEDSLLSSSETKHSNAYLYAYLNPTEPVWVTIGLSADSYENSIGSATIDEGQINPKLGVIWKASPTTRIRLAGFRALKRSHLSNQTLEPTQVAGFNQFFDDVFGTDSVRYGMGIEQAILGNVTTGLELTRRSLTVPLPNSSTGAVFQDDQRQSADRLYLHWLMTDRTAVSAEYYDERFERDLPRNDLRTPNSLITKTAPIMMSYFHPGGFFGKVRASRVAQKIEGSAVGLGQDRFWIFDMTLGYRLPRRFGTVSLDVKNMLDEKFKFHDVDFQNGTVPRGLYQPERTMFLRFTLGL